MGSGPAFDDFAVHTDGCLAHRLAARPAMSRGEVGVHTDRAVGYRSLIWLGKVRGDHFFFRLPEASFLTSTAELEEFPLLFLPKAASKCEHWSKKSIKHQQKTFFIFALSVDGGFPQGLVFLNPSAFSAVIADCNQLSAMEHGQLRHDSGIRFQHELTCPAAGVPHTHDRART